MGLTLSAVGQFGGEWLGFPRSGNFLIAPGAVFVMVGFTAFAVSARRTVTRTVYSNLAFLIALLPLIFFPVAMLIEVLSGQSFPPSLDDYYFTILEIIDELLLVRAQYADSS